MSLSIDEQLLSAAERGDLRDFQRCLDEGANPKAKTELEGWNVLHLACRNQHLEIAEKAADLVDLDLCDIFSFPALYYTQTNHRIFKLLTAKGAVNNRGISDRSITDLTSTLLLNSSAAVFEDHLKKHGINEEENLMRALGGAFVCGNAEVCRLLMASLPSVVSFFEEKLFKAAFKDEIVQFTFIVEKLNQNIDDPVLRQQLWRRAGSDVRKYLEK